MCRAARRYGEPFQAFRGVTQGGPLSPKIFNIMVDAVVREWMRRLLSDDACANGYGYAVWAFLAIFYADDAFVAARDPVKLQRALDILVDLFERVGLRINTEKTKAMASVPGKIRTCILAAAYSNAREGLLTARKRLQSYVDCNICG